MMKGTLKDNVYTFKIPAYNIVITIYEENGEWVGGAIDPGDICRKNKRADGIISMMLAHAVAGVDVQSPEYLEGLETAIESAFNEE
jgi:hypothetical protein